MTLRVHMGDGVRRTFKAMQELAFNGPVLEADYPRIAAVAGLSERQTKTNVARLRELGFIDWTQARRPGCKWRHNVYTLCEWNPVDRRKSLRKLADFKLARARRNRELHAERTTGRWGPTKLGPSTSVTRTANVQNARASEISPRRSSMPGQPPKPDDVCGLCGLSPSEHDGLMCLARRQAGQIKRLEDKLKASDEDVSAASRRAMALAHEWREFFGKPAGISLSPRGPRVMALRRAFGWNFSDERIRLCFEGARRFPFVVYGQRATSGAPQQRKDDLTELLRDEKTIEALIGLASAPSSVGQVPGGGERAARSPVIPVAARPLTADDLSARLEAVRHIGAGQYEARCPAHDDRHASFNYRNGDGGLVVHCKLGCDHAKIAAALGEPVSRFFWSNDIPVPAAKPVPSDPLPSDAQLAVWHRALMASDRLLERLRMVKGWSPRTLRKLGVGWDPQRKRLTLPVRDGDGKLVSVGFYLPGGKPKMIQLKGRQRGLFPAPETTTGRLWLLEGEPDAVTAHELGLSGVAVPGVNGFRAEWSKRFDGRDVVVLFDCDRGGREAAPRVAGMVREYARSVRVVDLDEERDSGYDLTDAVRDGITVELLCAMAQKAHVVHRLRGVA